MNKNLCMGCPVALDFERDHILSWVAYHHLLGVDCFVLLLDMRRTHLSDESTLSVHRQLKSLPALIELVPFNAASEIILSDLARALRSLRLLPGRNSQTP